MSEWQAEAEELNQSQRVGTCILIGLFFRFCFRLQQSGFHKSVSDGFISGVRRRWKRSDSSDSDSVALMTPLTNLIFDFHKVINALTTLLTTPTLMKTSLNNVMFFLLLLLLLLLLSRP